jgi:protein involved in polysaccharide export with SLBB domain
MKLRIIFLGILLLINSNLLLSQVFPLGLQIPNLYRSGYSNNIAPQQSISKKRSYLPTSSEKLYNDSIINARTSKSNLSNNDIDTALVSLRKKIFGFAIFNNKVGVFEPNLKIATPKSYIIGPDDELIVDINGYSEEHYTLTVSPDGFVKINKIGNVYVAGLTIDEAKNRIIKKLSQIYIGLKANSNNSGPMSLSASISLGNIRTVSVTVQGEVMFPGTYSVPSLARIMNVLYLAGGPNEKGTFREIQVIRNKKVFATIDLYDLLTSGIQKNDINIQDQDIIKVGVYKNRIELKGKIKREGLFEVLANENFDYVLNEFGGGFTENAFKDLIKVKRFTNRDLKLIDLSADLFNSFHPISGDVFIAESIDETHFENKVSINGEVFRPGDFSLDSNPTLLKLISRAGGLRETSFLERGVIQRINPDLSADNLAFNLKDILNKKSPDILLRREDQVTIFSILELKEKYTVTIHGEINLKTLKKASRAINEINNNSSKLGISGDVNNNENNFKQQNTNARSGNFNVNGGDDISNLQDEEGNNVVSSEISNDFKSSETSDALINRQVKLTLPYSDHMTVEDLILKAGGLRESAATGYVEIVRRKKNIGLDSPNLINSQIAEIIKFGISNNLQLDNTASKFELVPFDEVFIRTSPNYELQQFVTVQGQVVFPGVFGLERKDERLSDIVKRAGGLNNQAFPEGAKLIRKNHLTEAEKIRKIDQLNEISDNFTGAIIQNKEKYNKETEKIGIDLVAALKNPTGEEDLFLLEGDIIDIPKEPQTVKVTGEVLYPNSVKYLSTNTFKDFINGAGGYTTSSARKKSYVIYSNGSVRRVKSFGFIKIYPKIDKGSEIIVPKEVKSSSSGQQIASIVGIFTGTLTSLIGIVTLIRTTTN